MLHPQGGADACQPTDKASPVPIADRSALDEKRPRKPEVRAVMPEALGAEVVRNATGTDRAQLPIIGWAANTRGCLGLGVGAPSGCECGCGHERAFAVTGGYPPSGSPASIHFS